MPSNTNHSEKRGSTGPISKIGFTCNGVGPMGVKYSFIPPLMISHLSSRNPLISIAPQNETSPSPWEKCISPVLRFAPSTNTGR
uniref:Uncharacterized protein n=1 Tax=Arundo donax TaxID=35708 RepID=A0A0A9CJ71_ARUDO